MKNGTLRPARVVYRMELTADDLVIFPSRFTAARTLARGQGKERRQGEGQTAPESFRAMIERQAIK